MKLRASVYTATCQTCTQAITPSHGSTAAHSLSGARDVALYLRISKVINFTKPVRVHYARTGRQVQRNLRNEEIDPG